MIDSLVGLINMNNVKLQIITHNDEDTLKLLKSNTSEMVELNIKVNGNSVCLGCLDHHDAQGGHNGTCQSCGTWLDESPNPWH